MYTSAHAGECKPRGHAQKAHILARKSALCSLYVLTDADDGAADECGLTSDYRVHVASQTKAGLKRRVFNPDTHAEMEMKIK